MTFKSDHILITPLARTTVPIYHLFRMISITFLQQAPMHLIFEEGILLLRDYLRRRSPTSLRLGRARRPLSRTSPFLPRTPEQSQTRKNNLKEYSSALPDPLANPAIPPDPHPHQSESITARIQHGRRGGGVLPTSSGKSQVPPMAILEVQRSTLIFAPTIDLMNQ